MEPERELLGRHPRRLLGQQDQQLAVAQRDVDGLAVEPHVRAVAAEHGELEPRRRAAGGPVRGARRRLERELDERGGRRHEPERVRMDGLHRRGQVDRPEQQAGRGVVDRGGRARPPLRVRAEVLGGEDLHGLAGRERDADRVRARRVLAEARAGDHPEPVGRLAPDAAVAVDGEQQAARVGERDQVVGRGRDRSERLPQHRGVRPEAVVAEPGGRRLLGLLDRRGAQLGVEPLRGRAAPGVEDRVADAGGRAVAFQELLAREPQLTCALGRVVRHVEGEPGIGHRVHLRP